MLWISYTGRFGLEEIGRLEQQDPADILEALMASPAIVALRSAFEVLINGGEEKLRYLLSDEGFNAHWQEYYTDWEVDTDDFRYAEQLERRLEQMAN
ncbi:hypothetical protein KA078_02295 [Candidatus Woesebacteria bacterium]|nr:hypothetical protein [Candidatus Woesebacteria bacterium]